MSVKRIYCRDGKHRVHPSAIFDRAARDPMCLACRERMIARGPVRITPTVRTLPAARFRMIPR